MGLIITMNNSQSIKLETLTQWLEKITRSGNLNKWVIIYTRVALGAAFLSAVASRLGLWNGSFSYDRFQQFIVYTGKVNSFMPEFTYPFLAWAATTTELILGVSLIVGFKLRYTAIASAMLLAVFGTAMAISFGIKEPLDYSVYSASAAALLLAIKTK